MHKFYFNECLPLCENQHDFIAYFSQVLFEFKELNNKCSNIDKAIITEKLPSEMYLGNAYSLYQCIEDIEDRELKQWAFSLFIKYPIETHYSTDELIDELLEHEYNLTINKQNYNALNLAIVQKNNGFLFTIPLHLDLAQHPLQISSKKGGEIRNLFNLYGKASNTKEVESIISQLNIENASIFEQLKLTLGICYYTNSFEKDFLGLPLLIQQSIIQEFTKAKARGLITPFYPDTKIIKDVTPANNKCKVYELRIYSPVALRVYFNETGGKVYLTNIEQKSNANQNEDIKKSHIQLYKLMISS